MSNLTIKQGRIEQSNFSDYLVARTDITPDTRVHIVESNAPPGGVGEPGVPPIAPAICNAIYAATGKRIRELADRFWSIEGNLASKQCGSFELERYRDGFAS